MLLLDLSEKNIDKLSLDKILVMIILKNVQNHINK